MNLYTIAEQYHKNTYRITKIQYNFQYVPHNREYINVKTIHTYTIMEDYMMTNISDYDTMDEIMRKILEEYNMIDNHKTWAVPEYSKRQINNAGKTIANPNASTEERDEALKILNNWRAAHAYPLQIICDHLRKHNKNANVVQRLKRLESIVDKIERFPDMQLYKMQDLGGCRVIVDSISEVYEAIEQYKNSRIRHKLKREYDYIQHPKDSGYRCCHMVYQYHIRLQELLPLPLQEEYPCMQGRTLRQIYRQ